jgi:hypothetical protein
MKTSRHPLLTNSDAMITQITSDLSSGRRSLIAKMEMNFVLVPDNQPAATRLLRPTLQPIVSAATNSPTFFRVLGN